ncbi:hypothetical protein [Solimonas aquatica]|uniref:hypothetical protein n=1 Tax=Solimonas aquatica TaxID=489703 RepID=UPI0011605853|nr:hypothetical protein [Solimonas aquatica]
MSAFRALAICRSSKRPCGTVPEMLGISLGLPLQRQPAILSSVDSVLVLQLVKTLLLIQLHRAERVQKALSETICSIEIHNSFRSQNFTS